MAHENPRDPLGVRFFPYYEGRDPCRTPMQWSDAPGGGFTDSEVPWLPLGDVTAANVGGQRDDRGSVLTLCRDVIGFRRRRPELVAGDYVSLPSPEGVWAFGRGARHVVVLNMSGAELQLDNLSGTVRICTDRVREHEVVSGALRLPAYCGSILERA